MIFKNYEKNLLVEKFKNKIKFKKIQIMQVKNIFNIDILPLYDYRVGVVTMQYLVYQVPNSIPE